MKFLSYGVGLTVLAASLTGSTLAQTSAQPTAGQSVLPAIFVHDLAITEQTGTTLAGTFTLRNADQAAHGDLHYDIQLVSPEPEKQPGKITADNYTLYDVAHTPETLSVGSSATKQVAFTYQLPQVPAGTYRLRIQLKTGSDRELGWGEAPVTLTGGAASFVTLNATQIRVASLDPATGQPRETWAALEGPSVTPGAPFVVELLAGVTGDTPITGTWQAQVERLLTAEGETATGSVGEAVTLQPGEPALTSLPLTAQTKPGAYRVLISLEDAGGSRVSGLAEFRYVVQGESASLLPHSIPAPHFRSGDTIEVLFGVAGPADRTSTFSGAVEVALFDADTPVGSAQNAVEVSKSNSLTARADITLTAPVCKELRSVVTLRDKAGAVLDVQEQTYSDLAIPACGFFSKLTPTHLRLLAAAALIVLLAIVLATWMKRRRRIPTIGTPLLWLLMAATAVLLGLGQPAQAGIQFTQGAAAGSSVWVNLPSHDQQIAASPVTFQARLEWTNCLCSGGFDRISVYSRTAGGKISTLPQDAAGNYTVAPAEWRLEDSTALAGQQFYNASLFLPYPHPHPDTTLLTTVTTKISNPQDQPGVAYDMTWLRFPALDTGENPQAKINVAGNSCLDSTVTADGSTSFDPGGVSPKGVIALYDWTVTGPDNGAVDVTEEAISPGGTNNCEPGPGGGDSVPTPDTRMRIIWSPPLNNPTQCPGDFGFKNDGRGDVRPRAYVYQDNILTRFNDGEWFDIVKNGQPIVDGAVDPDVQGIAVKRGKGFVEFTLYGEWPDGGPDFETAYGRLEIEGVPIKSVTTHGVEGSGDGRCGRELGAGSRDEVFWKTGGKRVDFYLHVDKAKDRFTVFYETGEDGGGGGECPEPFGSKISFPATVEGVYPITLNVTDYDGNVGTMTTSATVFNQAPVPLIAPVERIVAREPVTLDGTKSFDPDTTRCGDTITSWEWEVKDPDGNPVSLDPANTPTVEFSPPVSGPYEATLTVTDNRGKASSRTQLLGVDLRDFDPTQIREVD